MNFDFFKPKKKVEESSSEDEAIRNLSVEELKDTYTPVTNFLAGLYVQKEQDSRKNKKN